MGAMMAIAVPQPGEEISAELFGAPVANQLNALIPTAWVQATLQNGATHFAASPVGYRKEGDLVRLRGRCENVPVGWTALTTLPVGFRPPAELMFATGVVISGVWTTACVSIQTNGVVSMSVNVTSATFNFAFAI